MTAIRAVSSTEEGILGDETDESSDAIRGRLAYWEKFIKTMAGTNTIFDTNNIKIKSNFSSGSLTRVNDKKLPKLRFEITTRSSGLLKVATCGTEINGNIRFVEYVREHRSKLEEITVRTLDFRIIEDQERQVITFGPLADVPAKKYLDKTENTDLRDKMLDWFKLNFEKVELELIDLNQRFLESSSEN